MRLLFRLFFLSVCLHPATAQQRQPVAQTYCNPMDISYRYNFEQLNEKVSYRSGADPVVINHKGDYYLFVTIQGGWWHSKDMVNWDYVVPDKWPMEDMCAPAALSVRDTLYLFQSTFEQRPIFYSTEPEKGKLKFYNRWLPRLPKDIGPWDPALFHDDDTDKWYMYWGSSNVYPIFGAELDKSRNLTYAGNNPAEAYKAMFWLDPYKHGWERFGPNHSDPFKPFTEGAWMTKYKGKYYLQYGAPGTEYNVYGNGTYVGKSPLGPWEYAPYNPIAYKPGGFATGCGHGNTFQDNYGNYWNTGTTWIGVNWGMERRIVMHPAGFDKDDQMNVNTRFGDFPHYLPTKKETGVDSPGLDGQSRDGLFTGWMLLNYKKLVVASSTLTAAPTDTLTADRVADENPRTFWVAGQNRPGETLTTDLGAECDIRAVQVDYFDYKLDIFDSDSTVYTQFKILTSTDGKKFNVVADLSKEPKKDHACAYVEIPARADGKPVRARYVRYEHGYTAGKHLSINAFRVFGNGFGKAPATPATLTAKRQKDQRNADLSWSKVPGHDGGPRNGGPAVGYNIRWGIAPDKLYQTYQFWHDQPNTFELRALNVDVPYYFAIEAFNENGVSALSKVVSDGSAVRRPGLGNSARK